VGLCDDPSGARFLVINGINGRVHYAEISEATDAAITTGAIVCLGADAGKARTVDQTVANIAEANGALTAPHFIAHPIPLPDPNTSKPTCGVWKPCDGWPDWSWSIPVGHVANGTALDRTRDGAQVDLLSPVPLKRLKTARAQTWLDRELVADSVTPIRSREFESLDRLADIGRGVLLHEMLGAGQNLHFGAGELGLKALPLAVSKTGILIENGHCDGGHQSLWNLRLCRNFVKGTRDHAQAPRSAPIL
jgi:hypothetical protein